MTRLILASGSAGRKSLFTSLKIPFEVVESSVDEEKIMDDDPVKLACKRAEAKAENVFQKLLVETQHVASHDENRKNVQGIVSANRAGGGETRHGASLQKNTILILGADTVGYLGDWIFGKPKSRKEAEEMMKRLSEKTHKYVSAFTIIKLENPKIQKTDYDISSVTFRKLSDLDIKTYLDLVEYKKLCGAFKINDSPQNFVTKIEGSISNIVGLSLEKIIPILKENFLL